MGSLLGGAAIGAAFQEALKRALDEIIRVSMYPSTLQTYISTLEALDPLVQEIIRYDQELDRPREVEMLTREMQAGRELVRRYSNVSCWKFLCFPLYQRKLQAGDESLRRTLSVNVQAQMARDVKEILKKVTDILMILIEQFGHVNYGLGTALYGAPENPDFTVGLDRLLNQLKFELLKDGVSFLNLTGFGGSGKTTLAKKLCWDPQVLGKFEQNKIFFATFSRKPDLKIILERLFKHFRQPEPEFQSNEGPGDKLLRLLNQVGRSPILLVLDDVWPGSEDLVEKFEVPIPDLKILVTSREELNLKSCISCRLEPLSHEDSIILFRRFAQLNDTTSCPPHNLVLEAVKCCRGLPLAIQMIGRKLRRQHIEFWQVMVKKLKQGRGSIINSDSDVLRFLERCLDVLENKSIVKECFMDLGLFPEDQMIPVSALVDICTELHKLDEEFCAMPYIYGLTFKNLSNMVVTRKVASEADNYYNNHFMTQHDLLRDLAIHLSNQEPFEQRRNLIIDINGNDRPELWSKAKQQGIIARIFHKWFIKKAQQQVTARTVSISSGETFNSKWWDMKPNMAEVLVLNLGSNDYTLPGFIKYMRKLRVLILTNYSFHPSQLHSFELLGSLSNLKRIRLQRVSVPSLCILKNLKKLSLYMCETSQAFSTTSSFKDTLPNLVDMSIDYCKDLEGLPGGFCDIISLEKLSITNCHKFSGLPQDIGKLENLQVLRLYNCTALTDIPDSITRLQKLRLLDVSSCTSLQSLPDNIGELSNLSKFYMMDCSRLSALPDSVTMLEKLEKVICDEDTAILWESKFDPPAPRPSIEIAKIDNSLRWLVGGRC